MTADELHSRRREIVVQAVQSGCVEECLQALESLDTAAQSKRNAYYNFLNELEALVRLFKAAEGQPGLQDTSAALIIAALSKFRETLKKPETESA